VALNRNRPSRAPHIAGTGTVPEGPGNGGHRPRLFFALPESAAFLLAGGAALLATGLSERPSAYVDLFSSELAAGVGPAVKAFVFSSELAAGVGPAVKAFVAACRRPGWIVVVIRDAATFCRLHVSAPIEEVLADLTVDSPPTGPPFVTSLAPTFPPREIALRTQCAKNEHPGRGITDAGR
jgi:hypothetical protein